MPKYRIISETGAWVDGQRREQGYEFESPADATTVDVLRHFRAIEEVVETPASSEPTAPVQDQEKPPAGAAEQPGKASAQAEAEPEPAKGTRRKARS